MRRLREDHLGFAPGARQIPQARAPGKRVRRAQKRHPTRGIA
nr:MAG TPA: hypothetical protein [Caudoviricetes sp.]